MKEVKIYTIVSDQLSPPITGESFCTDMVRHSDYAELEAKSAALAAENAGLKHAMAVTLEHVSVTDAGQAGVAAMIINDALHHSEPPATDAFLAEMRASARNEGINYAASRLAAAFNHGFLDKPVSEVL
ncbi:Eae-like protein, partial [Salmonella enterica subsp. diarizonae]|nr:Eae-like protein [Salmonella enterica subsp. diarizonae]